jgi:hypothetical protein
MVEKYSNKHDCTSITNRFKNKKQKKLKINRTKNNGILRLEGKIPDLKRRFLIFGSR